MVGRALPELSHRAAALAGKQQLLLDQKAGLLMQQARANTIIGDAKMMDSILDQFQAKAFELGGGAMEQLLSAMLRDVFFHDDAKQAVKLRATVKNRQPQLHIKTEKNGQHLDVLTGRGGSVVNVISTALSLIAVVRHWQTRPILFIDEGDCWVASENVGRYFQVLSKCCDQLGLQVVFLSHHNVALPASVTELRLTPGKNGLESQPVTGTVSGVHSAVDIHDEQATERQQRRLSSVTLENVLAHERTTLTLNAGLNLVRGDNDSGKTCILRAVSAMMENSFLGCDSFLHHGAINGAVTLSFEDGCRVRWAIDTSKARRLATGIKGVRVMYELCLSGEEVPRRFELDLGKPVPDDVKAAMGFVHHRGQNINMIEQLNPLGMLSPAFSAEDRARLIDLGNEFLLAIGLYQLHRDKLKALRAESRHLSGQVGEIDAALEVVRPIGTAQHIADNLAGFSQYRNELNTSETSAALTELRCLEARRSASQGVSRAEFLFKALKGVAQYRQYFANRTKAVPSFVAHQQAPSGTAELQGIQGLHQLLTEMSEVKQALSERCRVWGALRSNTMARGRIKMAEIASKMVVYTAGWRQQKQMAIDAFFSANETLSLHAQGGCSLRQAKEDYRVLKTAIPHCAECGQPLLEGSHRDKTELG
ncbi:AAA family ATPase [Aliagarivorans taiwanensis]|uniref:AAA family ATPase n=1 Tax=Aliagarivorans taiwanensis TaxID=561966 RepID=UPI0004000063|nr:AAA family ATPase [Aliagarivorans taiwanensis]